MRRYPIFLNLEGKKAVVFGAGAVALRKIKGLLASGACVEVVSRDFSQAVVRLAKRRPNLKLKPGNTFPSLDKKTDLAFAATSDPSFNKRIVRECRRRKILVNVADQPELCDFFVPSVVKKGKLELAISTGGASPLLARRLREELSRQLRPEAIRALNRMVKVRAHAKSEIASQKGRKLFLKRSVKSDFHFLKNGMNAK